MTGVGVFYGLSVLETKGIINFCFTKKENEDEEDCFYCDVDDDVYGER